MSWRRATALLTVCGLGAWAATPQGAPDFNALYVHHQWLELRTAVAADRRSAPTFYRGAVETAFGPTRDGERDLLTVVAMHRRSGADPTTRDGAAEAHDILEGLYFRTGRYRAALNQLRARLAQVPDDKSAKNALPLLEALTATPDQIVAARESTTVAMRFEDGNGFLPITINGRAAEYVFDTGANISVISESDAARLGLDTHDVATSVSGITSTNVHSKVAVATRLTLGRITLDHVAFVVVSDQQEPFKGLPAGRQGILGIPVLLALQTLRWTPKTQSFECGFPPPAADAAQAVIFFDGATPATVAEYEHTPIAVMLDTGAQDTELYPPFAKAFEGFVKATGTEESHQLTGLDGSAAYSSVLVPSVTLHLAGRDLPLRPAHVLLKEGNSWSRWAFGNLGMDLLNQARSVTIDFVHMRLSLQ